MSQVIIKLSKYIIPQRDTVAGVVYYNVITSNIKLNDCGNFIL